MQTRPLNPFAQVEQSINASAQAMLANAVAVYQGGEPFGVLFERTAADPFSGAVDTAEMTVEYCVANTPGIQEGSELVIDGAAYTVTGQVQPDASGWVVLQVYPAA